MRLNNDFKVVKESNFVLTSFEKHENCLRFFLSLFLFLCVGAMNGKKFLSIFWVDKKVPYTIHKMILFYQKVNYVKLDTKPIHNIRHTTEMLSYFYMLR